ncbi:ABC transporter substrate-binding protein [Pectinatus haikarae]|uniref:NitT/TauT family transport system substrate-binding protein n=1 Tax=Pectinatus haikarae TaxID=349096 RepID=A0ABT9Y6R7_9FIRM|nr:ABC transporter substrate-binding protein [Pectinatus haikarae]MDQ0203424.1 NitT/TauT family transport system substrate-binding protein [Pectinatus haikarae]
MNSKWKKVFAMGLISTVLLAATGCGGNTDTQSSGSGETAKNDKVIIGQSSWIGFAPLYIAEEKGFFKKHGADVEIQSIESKTDSKTALAADRIQGISTDMSTQVMNAAAGIDLTQILALDTSAGGDGIVAKKEYKIIEDLKGKKIALDTTGGADYFWFQYLLQQKGMTLKDFDVQNMSAGDAGAAFVAGKVDAAITWQPWLSKAEKTDFGHTLMDSNATPGVIVDTFAMKKSYIKEHPQAAKAIVAGWYEALEYMKTNNDDAIAIIAKRVGEKPENVKDELKDVKFYDQAGNKEYFGTADQKGEFYKITAIAAKLWKDLGLVDKDVNADSIIDGSFLDPQ